MPLYAYAMPCCAILYHLSKPETAEKQPSNQLSILHISIHDSETLGQIVRTRERQKDKIDNMGGTNEQKSRVNLHSTFSLLIFRSFPTAINIDKTYKTKRKRDNINKLRHSIL